MTDKIMKIYRPAAVKGLINCINVSQMEPENESSC